MMPSPSFERSPSGAGDPTSERVLQYVVDNLPAWIFWKDRRGVYLGCNQRFAELDGRADPSEIVGRTDHDMAWKDHADLYRQGDLQVMETGEPVLNREEPSPDGKGGQMVILTSKVPLRDESGDVIGILGILVDITDRKQMEFELARAKESAEQAARAKGQFLANVSHELRTPLTLILSPVSDALRDPSLPASTRPLLERIQRSALRLYMLVNDVLDFSRGEAGRSAVHRQDVDVVRALRGLVEDTMPLAQARRLALELCTDLEHLPALLDPRLLERIVLNLLSNALKFTPVGGHVRVDLSCEVGCIRIDVADDGIGIPKAAQHALFEPFSQVDGSATRRHEGTGLGLALVKHFVGLLGGSVAVLSEEGRGATFQVRLPLERGGASAAAPATPEARDGLGSRAWQERTASETSAPPTRVERAGAPRVLVADDSAVIREYLTEILQKEYSVETAPDGLVAWRRLLAEHFDVVISDVMMPKLDGVALTRRIKSQPTLAPLPVLLLTARGGAEASAEGLDAGADDYLAKPFAAEELLARVRAALRMSQLQRDLRAHARQAGMADVATSVLHNVGNVLSSVNVAADVATSIVRSSQAASLGKAVRLLREQTDPGRFLADDVRGRSFIDYLAAVAETAEGERSALLSELEILSQRLDHLRSIVSAQQAFARPVGAVERFALSDLINDALLLNAGLEVDVRRGPILAACLETDRHKVLEILGNLLSNARHAVCASGRGGQITMRARSVPDQRIAIEVEDSGVGIAPEHLDRVFQLGFTTKPNGHGFGLHASACAAAELGGTLSAHSDGVGLGARFVLTIPQVHPRGHHDPEILVAGGEGV